MKHEVIRFSDADIATEKWRNIPNYEGVYQASNLGRIRSSPGKTTYTEKHGKRKWKCRVMQYKGVTSKTGYRVSLWRDGKSKDYLVARLVAITWIGAPDEGMTVNHINGNRLDNRIENLEWTTLADNIRHAFETGLISTRKPVVLVDKEGNSAFFRSMSEASQHLGHSAKYISTALCRGRVVVDGYRIFIAA